MTLPNEWQGRVGDVWAEEWRRTDRAFAPLSRRLNAAILAVAPEGGRALDIGCGAGETSLALATERRGLDIVGADLSSALVEIATARAASGAAGAHFVVAPGQEAAGRHSPIDLFFSRHGVMFFDEPGAAFAALRAAGTPGAPLVFSCFGDWERNEFASAIGRIAGESEPPAGAPGPFAFADPRHVKALLEKAGWRDIAGDPVAFDYRAGEGEAAVDDAVDFLSRIGPAARALRDADPGRRPALLAALRECCEARHVADAVDFPAFGWIWSARA